MTIPQQMEYVLRPRELNLAVTTASASRTIRG